MDIDKQQAQNEDDNSKGMAAGRQRIKFFVTSFQEQMSTALEINKDELNQSKKMGDKITDFNSIKFI